MSQVPEIENVNGFRNVIAAVGEFSAGVLAEDVFARDCTKFLAKYSDPHAKKRIAHFNYQDEEKSLDGPMQLSQKNMFSERGGDSPLKGNGDLSSSLIRKFGGTT